MSKLKTKTDERKHRKIKSLEGWNDYGKTPSEQKNKKKQKKIELLNKHWEYQWRPLRNVNPRFLRITMKYINN